MYSGAAACQFSEGTILKSSIFSLLETSRFTEKDPTHAAHALTRGNIDLSRHLIHALFF